MPRIATTLAVALTLSATAAAPSFAGTIAGGTTPEAGSTQTGATEPGGASPAANGDLRASRAALLGRWQRVSGTLVGVGRGTAMVLQRSAGDAGWITIARGTTGSGGRFSVRWRPNRVGRFTLRAVTANDPGTATAADAPPSAPTTVYGALKATQYGRGSFGSRTACGTILRSTTIGVAHKTLPCGTLVEFYYRGRTLRAPVIDRGPYANGAAWDLTDAAAAELRFNGLDYVGAIRVGRVTLSRG